MYFALIGTVLSVLLIEERYGTDVKIKKYQPFLLGLFFFILFLLSTFRAENIGADYPEYIRIFHRIEQTGTAYYEKCFVLLNKLSLLFGNITNHEAV